MGSRPEAGREATRVAESGSNRPESGESLAALRGAAVSVLGAARSGVAAANLLVRAAGARVCLSDNRSEAQLAEHLAHLDPAVRLVTGRNDLSHRDLVVVSPGIPPGAAIWREVAATGAPVWGEIELGFRAARAPIAAITGTDGKTTTTALLGAILAADGRPHLVLGNIGRPLCDGVDTVPPEGALAVEVSCFQLLHVLRFRPRVAVLLNLAEDHLDYHPSFDHYVAAKLRVFARQGEGDTAVLALDDAGVRRHATAALPAGLRRWVFSGQQAATPAGVGLEEGVLVARTGGEPCPLLARAASPLLGAHNTENLAAAAAAGLALGVAPATVARALLAFRSLAHRLEPVRVLDGVSWVNDSKATSPHAALAGLRAVSGTVVLLAGGMDKGLDLAEWAGEVHRRCRQVVLTGPLAPRLAQQLAALEERQPGGPPVVRAGTFADAVAACRAAARPGDTVLLSPGCSSYDMFRSYEERGDVFRRLVEGMS